MNNLFALVITLLAGIFILIGTILVFSTKNNTKFIKFVVSMAFGVMISLSLFELIPEAYELLEDQNHTIIKIIFYTLVGIIILTSLDKLIPHHNHGHDEHHGEEHNMMHIGIVSSIALILHNIIEGMALYGTALEEKKLGLLVAFGIGLHNIPMGMIITSSFYKGNSSKLKIILINIGIALSTFVGGLTMFIMNNKLINNNIIGILICLTLGMLIYIALFELLPQMYCKKNKKINIIGLISGITIFLISKLF